MDKDIKTDLKKLVKDTEVKLTESILRWKHSREGKEIPDRQSLERQSRIITEQANEILSRRAKSIWNEIKKSYRKGREREDLND